jgi:hypothetical protein
MFGQPVSVADAPLKHHGTDSAPRPGYDVFDNSVAIASLSEPSAELRIESNLALETYIAERPPSARIVGARLLHLPLPRSEPCTMAQ